MLILPPITRSFEIPTPPRVVKDPLLTETLFVVLEMESDVEVVVCKSCVLI